MTHRMAKLKMPCGCGALIRWPHHGARIYGPCDCGNVVQVWTGDAGQCCIAPVKRADAGRWLIRQVRNLIRLSVRAAGSAMNSPQGGYSQDAFYAWDAATDAREPAARMEAWAGHMVAVVTSLEAENATLLAERDRLRADINRIRRNIGSAYGVARSAEQGR